MSSHLDGFDGATLFYEYWYAPDDFIYQETIDVGTWVEIGNSFGPDSDLAGLSIDIEGDLIFITQNPSFSGEVNYFGGGFNGFFLDDLFDEVPDITSVEIVSSTIPGFTASRISFDENVIAVDVQGLTAADFDEIVLDVDFASDIPLGQIFSDYPIIAQGLAASYQTLLGGVPHQAGFETLIDTAISTNFGAGPGAVFNAENIFINLANNLVQGNSTAYANFQSLAAGDTLAEKIGSLYLALIPEDYQTQEGLDFMTRPEGIAFYEGVAAERGVAGPEGAAIVAMASLLQIAVTTGIGIGDAVNDLMGAVIYDSHALPVSGSVFTHIEFADGVNYDDDDHLYAYSSSSYDAVLETSQLLRGPDSGQLDLI